MTKIVISEFMDTKAVDGLAAKFDVTYDADLVDKPDMLVSALQDASALIVRNRTQVTKTLVDGAPGLKCVGRLGVGLDNIDMAACAERGIDVFPATGANNLSVAEYVLTSALVLRRGAYLAHVSMLDGDWPRQQCSGDELAGATLGLVGFGGIAQLTADKANSLGMTVLAYDPYLSDDHPAWNGVRRSSFEDLLARSDVVSLHIPLTDDTRHLMAAGTLARMKETAILINAARGGVVDEAALVDALSANRLSGAALDVFEDEPLTKEGARKFAGLQNLLLTPHIAGVTKQSNTRVSAMIADKVSAHLVAKHP